jgi:hypothetical protein
LLKTRPNEVAMSLSKTATLLTLTAAALSVAPRAEAQCGPGAVFCADIHIGGFPPPPPVAQVVVVRPVAPPPPRVVVVQAPPPPPPQHIVVVQAPPPPQMVVVAEAEPALVRPVEEPGGYGIHAHLGGVAGRDISMGGATGALRLRRPNGRLALDLGVGFYAGEDYNGLDRVEVPVTADLLLYFNPTRRFQVYGLVGLGLSVASAEGFDRRTDQFTQRDYAHIGGEAGIGAEFRLSRWFALNADVRGFIRERIDDDSRPEFVNADDPSQATDTSAGVVGTLGATLYL